MTLNWKRANFVIYLISLACLTHVLWMIWPNQSNIIPGFEAKVHKDFLILAAMLVVPALPFLALYPFEVWLHKKITQTPARHFWLSLVFFVLRLIGFVFFASAALLTHASWGTN